MSSYFKDASCTSTSNFCFKVNYKLIAPFSSDRNWLRSRRSFACTYSEREKQPKSGLPKFCHVNGSFIFASTKPCISSGRAFNYKERAIGEAKPKLQQLQRSASWHNCHFFEDLNWQPFWKPSSGSKIGLSKTFFLSSPVVHVAIPKRSRRSKFRVFEKKFLRQMEEKNLSFIVSFYILFSNCAIITHSGSPQTSKLPLSGCNYFYKTPSEPN